MPEGTPSQLWDAFTFLSKTHIHIDINTLLIEEVRQAPRRCPQSHIVCCHCSMMFITGYQLFLHLRRPLANEVINMHNCSLQNTTKAVSTNKQTITQMIPMVSEVLCGMDLDTVNQVLVHWLHFSVGAEEEPGRDISLFSFCWAAAAHYPNFSSIFTACLEDK